MVGQRSMGEDPGSTLRVTRRVLATIEELDDRPRMVGRGMRTQRAGTVELLVSGIADPFPAVARGAGEEAVPPEVLPAPHPPGAVGVPGLDLVARVCRSGPAG